MQIMTPSHRGWNKFAILLEQECRFKQEDPNDINTLRWRCGGGQKKLYSRRILKKHFPKVDIPATFQYFEEHGGYCDCEILFNVEKGKSF